MTHAEAHLYHKEKEVGAHRLMERYKQNIPSADLLTTAWGNIAIEASRGAPSCPYTSTLLSPGTPKEECPACRVLGFHKKIPTEEWKLIKSDERPR